MIRAARILNIALFAALGSALLLLAAPVAKAQVKPWIKINDPSRFQVLQSFNNEAVLDRETGLIWQQTVGAGGFPHQTAVEGCLLAATGGRKGWRLPSVSELNSLVDGTTFTLPAGHPFGGAINNYMWSITPKSREAADDGQYFAVSPSLGGQSVFNGLFNYSKWCVRGGGETY